MLSLVTREQFVFVFGEVFMLFLVKREQFVFVFGEVFMLSLVKREQFVFMCGQGFVLQIHYHIAICVLSLCRDKTGIPVVHVGRLKLKLSKYAVTHTNYILHHCTILQYNHHI